MTDQEQAPEVELPKAETFDLGEWLDKKATYPKFTTTVYLDRQSAASISQLDEEAKKLKKVVDKAEKDVSSGDPFASIGESTPSSKEHKAAAKKLNELRKQRQELLERLQSSAVKIVFRVKDQDFHKRVTDQLIEKYKDRLEDTTATAVYELAKDDEQVASMQGHLQLLETISEMTNAEGKKADVKSYPDGEFFGQYAGSQDFVRENDIGLSVSGWGPDWPTGYGFGSKITHGDAIMETGI